jgi:hypothetical protein
MSARPRGLGRAGSVSLLFAVSCLTLVTVVGAALNIAQMAALRAALQTAADNAALSGAAAYSVNSSDYKTLAVIAATSAFCDAAAALPMGATLTAGSVSCGTARGPSVTAVTASYVTGVPGLSGSAGACASGYLPAAPYNCGFVVTVSATATVSAVLPSLFGSSQTVSVTAMAANPFVNFAKIFSLPGGVVSGATYANSIWAYPLKLNASGGIDYSTNAGALPDQSACTGGPDQVVCGSYVMLASTMYAGKGIGYTPPGQSVTYDDGVVRNPVSPTLITATTPLGIAFRSIAGGNYVQYTPPGVYGYTVTRSGSGSAPHYKYAPDGCIYPNSSLVYNTPTQVWTTHAGGNSLPSAPYAPQVPWPTVTHWFYSSYLTQNLPPSEGEILAQTPNGEDIPAVLLDAAQAGGYQSGPTWNAAPTPAVATTCRGTSAVNDLRETTTYRTTGDDNCSLYIGYSATAGYTPPSAAYAGSCFDPASTPGEQYAALSCQSFGSGYYTYYWNDMGGEAPDNDNYGDGVVQISCAAAAHVLLIG